MTPSITAGLALAAAALAVLACTLTLLVVRRSQGRQVQQEAVNSRALLRRLDALDAGVLNACEAIAQIGETLERLPRPSVAASGAGASYQVAIRLARSGASCEELVRDCGLSHSEAELVKRLHGVRRAS